MTNLLEAYQSMYEDQDWKERNFRSMPDKSIPKVADKARKLQADIKSQKSRPLARFRPGIRKDVKNKNNQLRNIIHSLRMKQGDVEARKRAHDSKIDHIRQKAHELGVRIHNLNKPQSVIAPGPKNWNRPSNKKVNASNTIKRFRREDIEYILDYLVNEGYANSYESAAGICESMSDAWVNSILGEVIVESSRRSQVASKQGRTPKPGAKSGKSSAPLDIKMAGMPGSGKSTMAKRLAKKTGGTATGYDDARETIHGNRSNQSKFPEVHKLTMDRLRDANKSKPRIKDNTNVNPKFKQSTDDSLKKDAGFRSITTVSPRTSQRRSFARNAKRDQPVPRFVMKSMASQEKEFRKSREGKGAVKTGKDLTKRFRLNRRSARARLGVENPKRGQA